MHDSTIKSRGKAAITYWRATALTAVSAVRAVALQYVIAAFPLLHYMIDVIATYSSPVCDSCHVVCRKSQDKV